MLNMMIWGMAIMSVLLGSGLCLDTSRLRDVGDFESQIKYILDSIRLTPEEIENITIVYNDMENMMRNIWPDCRIEPFGSTAAGLGMKSSDVDCSIILPNTTSISPVQCIKRARSYLKTNQTIFIDIEVDNADSDPLLSCYHTYVKRSVHLINTDPSYQRDTKLIHFYMNLDKRASDLAMIIKQWAKQQRIIGKYMRSFGIVMTVIFYLQQRNILPSVRQLQENTESVVFDHWETGFNENMEYRSDNNDTLYHLLGGFFEFYSTFDYDNDIVAPYKGHTVRRDLFANVDNVPDDYHLYKHNVKENITSPLKLDTKICIQDPFTHNGNSATLVCSKLAERIILQFELAAILYQRTSCVDFLTALLGDMTLDRLVGKESTC